MQGESPERAPWDEGAALEELERVHRAIDEWRTRRKDAGAAFDEFVSGFRTPPRERKIVEPSLSSHPRAPEVAPGFASALDAPLADLPEPVKAADLPRAASATDPVVPSGVPAPVHVEFPLSSIVAVLVQASRLPAEQRKHRARLAVVAGGVVVITLAGVLLTRSWLATPAGLSGIPAQSAAATGARGPQSAVPPASQTSSPVDPNAPRTEITALRRVWVRVVVDGTSEVERELQANERVPLRPGRTNVIRAGDAGAIRLTINGKDQGAFGAEGEVLTRILKIPASPKR
jgi:hypothetical protein